MACHRAMCACVLAAALLGLLSGCGVRPRDTALPVAQGEVAGKATPVADTTSGHVTVVASAMLTPFLKDVLKEFRGQAPGVTVELGELPQGSAGGPPQATADLVVAPDGPELAAAAQCGLGPVQEKQLIGRVPLALVVVRGNPLRLKSLEALGNATKVRIAVPDPAGDAAGASFTTALQKAGLWEQLAPRVETVPTSLAAREALEGGKVQAAISYAPPVVFAGAKGKLGIGFFLPAEKVAPAELVAAETGKGGNPAAQALLRYLQAARAQALLVKHGFTPSDKAPADGAGKSLLVPCGAALQPAMDVLAVEYEKRTGVRVDFSYAGAQMLLGQLAFSRHGDLYMPGEGFWVMQAVKRGYVQEFKPVVYFTPVIMVPPGNPKGIRTVQDMARPGVRVALGHPEALAVGPLTKRILQRAGVWEKIQRNVVMEAGCIPELTNAVVMKGADAGIMWDASALQVKEHIEIVPIDPELNEVAEVLLATLKFSVDPAEAKRFLEFVASEDAKAIFESMEFNTKRPTGIRLAPLEGPEVGAK